VRVFVSLRCLSALIPLCGAALLTAPVFADPMFVNGAEPDLPTVAQGVPKGGALRVFGLELDQHGPVDLELRRFRVFDPNAQLLGEDDTLLPIPDNAYFRGPVDGLPNAVAVLTVPADGRPRGVVTDENGIWLLGTKPGRVGAGLVSRKLAADELARMPPFKCGLEAMTGAGLPSAEAAAPAASDDGDLQTSALDSGVSHTARVAVETDYEYFALFGSETAALEYMGDLFAYASTVYEREVGTSLLISFARLWPGGADSDPWTATDGTDTALYELRDYWNANMGGEERTIAHMLSGKSLGGGIAYVGVLCNQSYGYGVSASLRGIFDISSPGVVWDLLVVTHEIGHNFDSSHTHDYCGVGGVADPVDLCYASSSCGSALGLPGIDSLSGGTTAEKPGTIMSYCHLVGGGYSNISFTFGLDYVFGVAADRVPTVMQSHVASRASIYPGCLDLVIDGPQLTVQRDGTGSGGVTSDPAGIDCGDTCAAYFALDTNVEMTATADAGSTFVGFSGACADDGSVLLDADKSCTATFDTLCGNGQLDAGEACDGALFADKSPCGGCVGTASCTAACAVDTTGCCNGVCEATENCATCAEDCISGSYGGAMCGNGICEAGNGEDCVSCPADCNGVQTGKPSGRYCCGDGDGVNPVGCGDGRCGNCTTTGVPGGSYCCGDGSCDGPEADLGCILDCGEPPPEPFCGDSICNNGEDSCGCPGDCGSPPVNEEGWCTDGLDNDCDGRTDTADVADCPLACAVSEASCSSNADCCSNNCLGKGGGTCK